MIALTSLHLLLTYQCNYECDHCFVWGSPLQDGVMTMAQVRDIYRQGQELGTVTSIYLEGGEPFLYYPIMVWAAREAAERGFQVGVLSNNYWATTVEDAMEWLRPFAGIVHDLSISTDLFHSDAVMDDHARNALAAAEQLGIPVGTLICDVPEGVAGYPAQEKGAPVESGAIMFKGRAAVKLVDGVARRPWSAFDACPYETLDDPGRVHVDPLGYLHLCQGINMGNLFERPLAELVAAYDPQAHPVVGPLLRGGPAALVAAYDLPHGDAYVDACHLCYTARLALRERFPQVLGPDQMYGDFREELR
ncbi:MAG: radical SAM protein [Anaerolineae bacterium]|nr:radical SAM protein [Anaerolineae bacterium]